MGQSVAGHVAEESPGSPGVSAIDPLDGAVTAGGTPTLAPADGQADDLLSQLAGAEIDRMLAEADVEPALPPPAAAPAADVPVAAVLAPVEAAPVEAAVATAEPPPPVAAPAADLDAVLSAAAAEKPAASPAAPAIPAQLDLGGPAPRWSLLLRPLVLINAPLDSYPDRVREAVGKVAVVTLVNAVAVIAYVVIFRRHG